MGNVLFYSAGHSEALNCAIRRLKQAGCSFSPAASKSVSHLLLPIPSLDPDGTLKGGNSLTQILCDLPEDVHIIGGNLPHFPKYTDLLTIPSYVAENAYITAHCAIQMVMNRLPRTLRGCSVLIIGWGRIGKCLAAILKGLDASVTVAARKETDRAILKALGYLTADTAALKDEGYQVILNTVPQLILKSENPLSLKIDLASSLGISGDDVIHARGLPDKLAPEASGDLIARTILHYIL